MTRALRWRTGPVRSLSSRAATGLICVCLLFALAAVGIGVAGMLGVRSTSAMASNISTDEVATGIATARAIRAIDFAYVTGQRLAGNLEPAARAELTSAQFDQTLPRADASVLALVALHTDDGKAELAHIDQFFHQWAALRRLLIPTVGATPRSQSTLSTELATAFAALSAKLDQFVTREEVDTKLGQTKAAQTTRTTMWIVGGSMTLVVFAAVGMAWVGIRRVRRALRPEEDQTDFADTMQLAANEEEAHDLLKRHLERAVKGSAVTVLSRNNSADRLEAATNLAPNSCLTKTLQHAAPSACLAVRSGRMHRQGGQSRSLLDCAVCGTCPGSSTCTPLTVGGEVIGSVLVNPPYSPTPAQSERVRTSVGQAAPILANLRNLAVAEIRAATDSLTGLANKRAVSDTLKRMLAQSSRTLSPFALLLIDLDHFKQINDVLGHPGGDEALASVSAAMTSVLRESDFAGRNGGEEFAVMLPDTGLEGALLTAEKIRAAIAGIDLPNKTPLTASLGVALYPEHATNAEKLERLADAALYAAKRAGRNRTEVAGDPDLAPAQSGEANPTTAEAV